MLRASTFTTALAVGCLAAAPAAAFVPSDVHRASADCLAAACRLLSIAPGAAAAPAPVAAPAPATLWTGAAGDASPGAELDADALVLRAVDEDASLRAAATGGGDTADVPLRRRPSLAAMDPFERGVLGLGLLVASWWLRPRFGRDREQAAPPAREGRAAR